MQTYNAIDLLEQNQIDYILSHPVKLIIDSLTSNSSARIVGGAVRDMILTYDNIVDFDVATTMLAGQVINVLKAHNMKFTSFGIDVGNIVAIFADTTVEITTLRRDVNCVGRKATVNCTDNYQLDAKRRDFTINGLRYCIKWSLQSYDNGRRCPMTMVVAVL